MGLCTSTTVDCTAEVKHYLASSDVTWFVTKEGCSRTVMGAATEQSASTDSYPPQPSANAIPLPPSPVESLTPGSAENGTVIANTAELETSPVAPRPGAAVGDTQRTSQQQPEQDDSILTPAMRVRRNIFNRTLAAVSNLGLSKRVLLFLKGAITLAQVGAVTRRCLGEPLQAHHRLNTGHCLCGHTRCHV